MLGPSQLKCNVQGDEDSIAEIWALTEEDLPIIPQAKQLKLASNPPPVAARPLPEGPYSPQSGTFKANLCREIMQVPFCCSALPAVSEWSASPSYQGCDGCTEADLYQQPFHISFSGLRKCEAS